MNKNKALMSEFISQKATETFILFYKLMTGNFNFNELTEQEKLISDCVKDECKNPDGVCYKYYQEIKEIKKSEETNKLSHLYECILQSMCEKMFFHSLKLGYVLQNKIN